MALKKQSLQFWRICFLSLFFFSMMFVHPWAGKLPISASQAFTSVHPLTSVQDFCYLLQADEVSVTTIADTHFDLVVMDYAKYGDAASEYTPAEITTIKTGGATGLPKVVLAYMSIGEAEDYRYYWDPNWVPGNPLWLGPNNPEWEGNYKVRFWMEGWKQVIYGTTVGPDKSYLDRIIDQGFDGVYLDIIDAYEFWASDAGGNERTREQARADMCEFVKALRDYARLTRGREDFLIFPQNGADIIYDDSTTVDALGQEYLDVCDGIGQEDTWYMEMEPQPQEETESLVRLLDIFKANGKLVLSVDYVWDTENPNSQPNKDRYNDYYTKARTQTYIPYAANRSRDLNDLIFVAQGDGFNFDQPICPACPECTGEKVVITDATFYSRTSCQCIARESITIGPGVTIQTGATVILRAPKVHVTAGFHAQSGCVVRMEQP